MRVFARKGFHASRVGDIAEEAGVAHGLLYHYFRSKDEVLETIFRETWTQLVADTQRIELAGVPLREQLRRFARIYLGSWLVTPELVRVLVREVARSPEVGRPGRRDPRALPGAAADHRGRPRRAARCAADVDAQSLRGPCTARWRRSSPAGCSASCRARRRTSSARSATVVDVAHAGLAACAIFNLADGAAREAPRARDGHRFARAMIGQAVGARADAASASTSCRRARRRGRITTS